MSAELTIGKVARQARVTVQTIRYYERRGLLSPSGHRDSGYRLYTQEAVQKIRFIKNAQGLGFTLKEISGLLRLRVNNRARCGTIKIKAEAKLEDIHAKIADLRAMQRVLKSLIKTCRRKSLTEECPILRSLEYRSGNLLKRVRV